MALTISSPSTVKSASGNTNGSVCIEMLDATHFVALYGNASLSVKAKYGTIAGDGSISYGAEATIFTNTANTSPISIGVLSSSKFVVFGRTGPNGNEVGKAYVCNVSGTTITMDGENNIDGTNFRYAVYGCALDSTHIAVTYGTANSSSCDLMVKVGSVSGNSISWGSAAQCGTVHIDIGSRINRAIVALTSTKFVVSCALYGPSTCSLFVCDVSSGTTVTPGTVQSWAYSGFGNLSKIDNSTFLLSLDCTAIASTTLYSSVCSVSATTITFNTATSRSLSNRKGTGLIALSSINAITLDSNADATYRYLYASQISLTSTTHTIGSAQLVINEDYYDQLYSSEYYSCRVDDSKALMIINKLSYDSANGTVQIYSFTFPAVGPANLKSFNTNLKANIKSYNTNLIGNAKSINTNV